MGITNRGSANVAAIDGAMRALGRYLDRDQQAFPNDDLDQLVAAIEGKRLFPLNGINRFAARRNTDP